MKPIKPGFILVVAMAVAAGCFGKEQQTTREKIEAKSIVEGNNKFAMALYAKLREQKGNLFFSPYSISTALALVYAGARGQTETQMADVLHFPIIVSPDKSATGGSSTIVPDRQQFASAFGKIVKDLNARGKKACPERSRGGSYELTIANALWGQKGYEFLKEFLRLIEANYDGQLNEVDFVTAAEAARNTINSWVEKKTNDKIKNLIGPGVLDEMTRLVLTNAIYFKGNWQSQFKEDRTRPAPFTLLDGDKPVSSAVERIEVPMMNQTAEFGYMETEDLQGLELPYVDEELSMIILLPKKIDGLSELEQTFTIENLSQWLGKLGLREVIVSIPKFKMTSQFSLASVLKSMGMTDAFTPDVANFSGMNGKTDLFISAVIHKAYVDVNEEGTEAAAATGVTMRLTSVGPSQIPVFRADHPFLFLIRDNKTRSILFIGRMTNPKA